MTIALFLTTLAILYHARATYTGTPATIDWRLCAAVWLVVGLRWIWVGAHRVRDYLEGIHLVSWSSE